MLSAQTKKSAPAPASWKTHGFVAFRLGGAARVLPLFCLPQVSFRRPVPVGLQSDSAWRQVLLGCAARTTPRPPGRRGGPQQHSPCLLLDIGVVVVLVLFVVLDEFTFPGLAALVDGKDGDGETNQQTHQLIHCVEVSGQ